MEFSIKTVSGGTKELYVDEKLIAIGTQEEILPIMNLIIERESMKKVANDGVQPVIQCEKCKYWKKYGYDPIIERCWGECCRPFGEDGVTKETAENDFCSFAKEATDYPTEKGGEW